MTRAVLVLATACAVAASAHAAEVHWSELSKVLKARTLVVGTKQGDTYEGRFLSSDPDSFILQNDKEVTIPRDTVKSIYAQGRDSRFSHLKNVGLYVLVGYVLPFTGFDDKPCPLLALLTIPMATVGGAIGAPIGLIRDLVELTQPPSEFIVILPDPAPGVTQ